MRNDWNILTLALCAGALALAMGPAGAQDGGAPPTQMFPTPGEGDEVGLIAGLCGVQMKDMSPQACRCLAEQSQTQLSAPQRDYLVATAVSPPAADRMLSDGRVSQPDQQAIFSFLNDTMRTCHGGTFDADAPPLPG